MDYDDYESLPTNNFTTHMTAGAIAGVLEHCIMYPLDSVKTRMQSLYHKPGQSISGIFLRMIQQEGFMRPLRGLSAVVMGAGPAHAFYFASYEYTKENLSRMTHHKYNQLAYGLAGCVATLIHDGISNPTEVVKQRMQMYNSPYRSVLQCVSTVYKKEGFRAFYRSYTTQLFMNVPFQSIHFMTYEFVQNHSNPERNYNPMAHMISGALAGAFAAAATTPLDVCKTLLNTEGKSRSMLNAMRHVYTLAGPLGYFRGMRARILYQMPAAAICWSTYEFFKYILIGDKSDPSNSSTKTVSKDESSFTDLSLRLVLPETNMAEDDSNPEVGNVVPSRSCNDMSGLKTRELPAVSGANLYGALSLNTMHSSNNTINTINTSRSRSDNTFFDMRTS